MVFGRGMLSGEALLIISALAHGSGSSGMPLVSGTWGPGLRTWGSGQGMPFGCRISAVLAHGSAVLAHGFSSSGMPLVSGTWGPGLRTWDSGQGMPFGCRLEAVILFACFLAFIIAQPTKVCSIFLKRSKEVLRGQEANDSEFLGGVVLKSYVLKPHRTHKTSF